MASSEAPRWNHNIHHHRVVLGAVPGDARRALDVGCGEGMLARQLRERVPEVAGIDRDDASIRLARRAGGGVALVLGDVMDAPFRVASFDLVASVATLHHVDAAEGLRRMAMLVRPGGTLVVVGLARPSGPRDLAVEALGLIVSRVLKHTRNHWEHSAPIVWPPPETYASMRRITRAVLPGAVFRRRLLLRYTIVWRRPAEG
ncbi:MAG TPA: class I SAM-dependent methyltransferase [Longimicrobiaceae bacterium]|nr:class I SAM-dependent methyltransferase [Longimicrobiaceae bacterium]